FCKSGCPIENNIPEFIQEIKSNNFEKAYKIIEEKSNLSAICGKICPHEKQCEGSCILNRKGNPIKIGALENFISNYAFENTIFNEKIEEKNLGNVAIIGSGPAGLSCAYILAKEGFNVTVYEMEKEFGGILAYGIPEFRLKKSSVKREIERLKNLGINFINNTHLGKNITIENLKENFDAIFIGTGANMPKAININGENLKGVISATEFLKQIPKLKNNEIKREDIEISENDTVLIIGGGNVAMDTARTVKRITENTTVVYRRTQAEMPASNAEYEETVKDNVDFMWRCSPLEFIGENGILTGLKVKNLDTEEEFIIKATKVLNAIGSKPIIECEEIELNDWGCINISENPFGQTNIEGVFSAGDVVTGPETVVLAMREARKTAYAIKDYILNK
ncbi:MAG: NAD(P)-dependent oxidoreductase, partial [Eubacteriales bacterium]|nr:NAD(P)-dependent oxidoreductase [Eubacteriales bacterium]